MADAPAREIRVAAASSSDFSYAKILYLHRSMWMKPLAGLSITTKWTYSSQAGQHFVAAQWAHFRRDLQ